MNNDDAARVLYTKCINMPGNDEWCIALLAAALDEARRDTWEAAAKMQCRYCNDPAWIARSKHGDHLSPTTGLVFECASKKLLVMAGQAQLLTPSQSQDMSRSGEEEAS